MAQPSISAIYDRIHSASGYHPLSAATFTDWSLEAGDIITLNRDGKSYSSPVHASQLVWKGAPQISIESTGNREKEAVAVMSSKKLSGSARGGSGYRNSREKNTSIQQNEDSIILEAHNRESADGILYSQITITAEAIRSEVANTAEGLYSTITQTADRIEAEVTDVNNSLSSRITQTATQIRSEVNDSVAGLQSSITQTATQIRSEVNDSVNSLQSSITEESNRISLVVEGTGSNAKIKPASIVAAINAQTGQSTVKIAADMIVLDGDAVAASLTSEDLTVETIDAQGGQSVFQDFYVSNSDAGGTDWYSTDVCIGAEVDETTNTLTLEFADGTTVDFSRATSLSGAWSSNTYTVTASPQGNTISTSVSSRFGVNQGNYYIESYRSADQDAPGISGSSITYQMANNNGTIELQNTEGTRIADTPTFTVPSSSVTLEGAWSNNTYTVAATSGSISGTIPSTTVMSRFASGNNSYYIETYRSSESGGPAVSGSTVSYKLAFVTSGAIQIQDTGNNPSRIANTPEFAIWWGQAGARVNHQGTLAYGTLYGLVSGSTVLTTWETPAAPTHSPSIDSVWTAQSTQSGWTQLNSLKTQYEAAKSDGDFFCIRVDCNGTKKTYWCEP